MDVVIGHIQLLAAGRPYARPFTIRAARGVIRGRVEIRNGDDLTASGPNGVDVLRSLVEEVARLRKRSAYDFGARVVDEDDDRVNVPYAQIFAVKHLASLRADG